MNKFTWLILVIVSVLLVGCADTPPSSAQVEHAQQEAGISALVRNQPVPTLQYSLERNIVIQTYQARNRKLATWTYMRDMNGRITEICPSIGYPIPYSTQLTNPQQLATQWLRNGTSSTGHSVDGVIGNPEPTGLYPPPSAEATLVTCVEPDGTAAPGYFEDKVFALPYRIHSDFKLERLDTVTSFKIDLSAAPTR